MQVDVAKYKDIFNRTKYEVPDYQRGYEWKDETHVTDFWHDIELQAKDFSNDSSDETELFLGTLIVQKIKQNKGKDIYEVVDGQQRLTTITILQIALRTVCYELQSIKESDLVDNIDWSALDLEGVAANLEEDMTQRSVTGRTQEVNLNAEKNIRPLINDMCNRDWDGTFKYKQRKAQKNVAKVYGYFLREIRRFCCIKNIQEEETYDNINLQNLHSLTLALESITFIKMEVKDRVGAYELFERTNARGKELEVADLLKNHLFAKEVTLQGRNLLDIWEEILENSNQKILGLLKYYHCVRGGYTTNKKLYRALKNISQAISPSDLLQELYEYSKFTRYINYCSEEADTEKYIHEAFSQNNNFNELTKNSIRRITEAIKGLDLFGTKQYQPVFYSIFYKFNELNIEGKKIKEYLPLIIENFENYHFVNTKILGQVAHDIETLYANSAHEIFLTKNENDFFTKINNLFSTMASELIGTRKQFIATFSDITYGVDPHSFIYYVWDRINSYDFEIKSNRNNTSKTLYTKRRSNDLWNEIYKKGSKYKDDVSLEHWVNKRDQDKYESINKIGNIIYLPLSVNTGRKKYNQLESPKEKSEYFKENPDYVNCSYNSYFLKKYDAEFEKWGEEMINKHGEHLAELAFDHIWKFHSKSFN